MPIYEFQCNACGHRFDELMRLSDPDPAACPACGAAQVQRQVTAPSFRLAGAGWYETDFKGDKDKRRNLAGNDADAKAPPSTPTEAPATAAKADAKSEPKPVAKPEAKPAAKPEPKPAAAPAKPDGGGTR
jgi:putative FmdB family regulatory protein